MGEELTARRAQDRSFELLARSTPADEPPWIYWYTESTAQHGAGESLMFLARPADAEPHLRRAVSMLDPSFTRDRGLALLDLATARIGMGAVERACATATEAAGIIRRLDSPRQRRLLAEFRATAAPYASSVTVKEFDAKHRDLLAPTPTYTPSGRGGDQAGVVVGFGQVWERVCRTEARVGLLMRFAGCP